MNIRQLFILIAVVLIVVAIFTGPPDFKERVNSWYFTGLALALLATVFFSSIIGEKMKAKGRSGSLNFVHFAWAGMMIMFLGSLFWTPANPYPSAVAFGAGLLMIVGTIVYYDAAQRPSKHQDLPKPQS